MYGGRRGRGRVGYFAVQSTRSFACKVDISFGSIAQLIIGTYQPPNNNINSELWGVECGVWGVICGDNFIDCLNFNLNKTEPSDGARTFEYLISDKIMNCTNQEKVHAVLFG